MKKIIPFLAFYFLFISNEIMSQQILLNENFESGTLNPFISFQSYGTFNSNPGIKNITNFGSTKSFGFGISTCPSNCFNGYLTDFTLTFPPMTFVDSMQYCEMELFDNWGSKGDIYINGNVLAKSYIGNVPSNDGSPDVTPRCKTIVINQQVNTIVLHVWDITTLSEINIDDLIVYGTSISQTTEIDNTLNKLSITPNPSAGRFYVSTPQKINYGDLEIYDKFSNRIIKENFVNESKKEINLEGRPKGIYFVKVSDGEKQYVQKLVIQ